MCLVSMRNTGVPSQAPVGEPTRLPLSPSSSLSPPSSPSPSPPPPSTPLHLEPMHNQGPVHVLTTWHFPMRKITFHLKNNNQFNAEYMKKRHLRPSWWRWKWASHFILLLADCTVSSGLLAQYQLVHQLFFWALTHEPLEQGNNAENDLQGELLQSSTAQGAYMQPGPPALSPALPGEVSLLLLSQLSRCFKYHFLSTSAATSSFLLPRL